jgi:pimeloyl-ACP methyl ester carboxylesterase
MASIKRIQLTSGVLHVESNGDPLGRLVLCVHGLSANCRSFDRFVPVLAEAGHHVVTMDLRGRGRSDITPPGSYGWDRHARDLLEIGEQYGVDSFDVIGHSMGGFIGMYLAAKYPRHCRRLVLIDAVGAPERSALLSIAKSVSRLGRTYPSASAVLSHMQAAGTIAPWDAFWDSYFGWELESFDDSVRIRTDLTAVREDSAYGSTQNVYELWPRLRCPVLLVRASRPMAPGGGLVVAPADADRFAAEARDATVVDVDADHYSILISTPAIGAVEQFVGAGRIA